MKSNKKVLIVVSIILISIISCLVLAYLYIATDMFKSDKELFAKYFNQNEETFQKITDWNVIELFKELKNENKYESNTDIKISYSEGGEISNPLNNLTAELDIQNDNEEQYTYVDGKILYEGETYLETELIKQEDVYGVRFKDIIEQFITLENDENINEIMSDIGVDFEKIKELADMFDEQTNNNQEILALKDKYLNIVFSEIANGEFSKQKDTVITYNKNIVKTNAYTVFLTNSKVENLLLTILENAKNETEILEKINDQEDYKNKIDEITEKIKEEIETPTIKITVYENKQKTLRTVIEIGDHNISIENAQQNNEITSKINYSNSSFETLNQLEITISKINNENEEKIEITTKILEGEDSFSITLSNLLQLTQENIKINTKLDYTYGITMVEIEMINNISIDQDFQKKQTLNEQNTRLINSLKSEKRKLIIEQLKELIIQKNNERIELLKIKMGLNDNENENVENEVSQIEINKFNAKFEFYTGEEVSTENVKALLNVVKNNLKSYEFLDNEVSNDTVGTNTENKKINVKLNIEKDKTDEESINKILEKITSSKKYQVSIKYNETNGMIDYITIKEI